MTARSGQCLCGAVAFEAGDTGDVGVCHCRMCQRWTGGPFFSVTVPKAEMRVTGSEAVTVRRTSNWATRSHCAICGAPLWYRFDRGTEGEGDYDVPIGLFDDTTGMTLSREIFSDAKPDCVALAGEHPRLSDAETLARLAPGGGG